MTSDSDKPSGNTKDVKAICWCGKNIIHEGKKKDMLGKVRVFV